MTSQLGLSTNRFENISPMQRILVFVGVVLTLVVVFMLIAETTVRTRQWYKYGTFWGFDLTQIDATTGLRVPIPNKSSGPVRINSLGFRGPEIESPKPQSTLRIAFLGGSTTFSQEVSGNEYVWPHLVWKNLTERFTTNTFDYVNAAVTAYSVNDSKLNFTHRVARYKPDIIVIYHAVNDIGINGMALALGEGLGENFKRKNDSLWSSLIRISLLADLVNKNFTIMLRREQANNVLTIIRFYQEFMVNAFRQDLHALVETARDTAKLVVLPTFSNRLRREQNDEMQLVAAATHLFHVPFFTISDLLDACNHVETRTGE